MRISSTLAPLLLSAALLVSGLACGSEGPQPIAYGHESCAWCRMAVSDRRFAAQLVTTRGKAHTFDSIECLASYYLRHRDAARSLWVSDAAHPGSFVRADSARFVVGGAGRSPMGLGLAAYATDSTSTIASSRQGDAGADALTWTQVLALVERTGGDPQAGHASPGAHDASR